MDEVPLVHADRDAQADNDRAQTKPDRRASGWSPRSLSRYACGMRLAICLLFVVGCGAARRPTATTLGFERGEVAVADAHTPADVARLCATSRAALTALRDAALAPGADVLAVARRFDRAATIAIGTADLLANLHPADSMREAARSCEAALTAIVTDVTTGPLVARLAALHDGYAQRIVANAKLAGAGLGAPALAELKTLLDREAKLTGEMAEALGTPPQPVIVDRARLAGLPAEFLARHPADAHGQVALDAGSDWRPVVRYAADRSVAIALLQAQRAVAVPGNTRRLTELLAIRHRMAELLGCGSYAECAARTRMVGTSARTAKFLADLTAMIDALGPSYLTALGATRDARWGEADVRFVEGQARERMGQTDPAAWLPYLETGPTLDRILAEVGAGTGLRFVPTQAPTWSPDVRVFDVMRGDARLGRFYFDLYQRPGKVPGTGQTIPFVPHTQGARDEPVAIAIAIGVPTGSPSLLQPPAYIKLLLHETGHAIDFLFETQSSLAPPEADFFDVPSQLFEAWPEDPAFLQAIGRRGAEPLPRAGAEVIAADLRWDGWKFLREVTAFGLIDLGYHGTQVPPDTSAVYADAYERVFPIRVDRGGHPEVELFMPTIVYAGNGHALPWGLAIATDLAGEFPHGLHDPKTWTRLFDQVLAASGPAEQRLESFLGRPWNLDRLRARALPPFGR